MTTSNWRGILSLSLVWALIINALGINTHLFRDLNTLQKLQGVLFCARCNYPRYHHFLKIWM